MRAIKFSTRCVYWNERGEDVGVQYMRNLYACILWAFQLWATTFILLCEKLYCTATNILIIVLRNFVIDVTQPEPFSITFNF